MTPSVYEALYVSTIAPSISVSVVGAIAGKSRAYNAANGVTGLLIFDGMYFCQQIEGLQEEVLSLIERISRDARHTNVTVFHHGVLAERRFKSFALAFTDVDDVDVLPRLRELNGQAGLTAYLDLVKRVELHA